MQKSKQSNRLALAVYLFLAALSVIFSLVAVFVFSNESSIQNLLLNLSTEVAGVVIIFFIVNRLFLLEQENEVKKKLDIIQDGIKKNFSPIVWEGWRTNAFNFETLSNSAQSIYLLGYNLVAFIKEYNEALARFVSQGINVKILIVDKDSKAGALLADVSNSKSWVQVDGERSIKHLRIIRNLIDDKNGNNSLLELRIMSWIPSSDLIIINKEEESGIAKVTVHHPSINVPMNKRIREHLDLILDSENYPREYQFFKKNFELMWEEKYTKVFNL